MIRYILEFCDNETIRRLTPFAGKPPDGDEIECAEEYGELVASYVRENYRLSGDSELLARTLGVREIYRFNAGIWRYGRFAEYDAKRAAIGLNSAAVELLPLVGRYYTISEKFLFDIFLTHELFHHLEEHFFTRTDEYVSKKLSKAKKYSLRDLAAFSFAERMLSFPVRVVDLLYLCQKYGQEKIYGIMRDVLTSRLYRERDCTGNELLFQF
jgi:hypothetical protein